MDLSTVHDELVEELRYNMLYIGTEPVSELADLFDLLAEQFEALALCHLLVNADLAEYRVNLIRSAQSRRYFLQRSVKEGFAGTMHFALSRTRSLLNAIAAGDINIARDIANASIETWHDNWEYEDDYCYFLSLHQIVRQQGPLPIANMNTILDRFEIALEGAESHRLNILRALIGRDVNMFAKSLYDLMDEEQSLVDEERASPHVQERDICFWPRSYVSIEGLALLNLAKWLSLDISTELPRCPPPALIQWSSSDVEDLFEAMERTP